MELKKYLTRYAGAVVLAGSALLSGCATRYQAPLEEMVESRNNDIKIGRYGDYTAPARTLIGGALNELDNFSSLEKGGLPYDNSDYLKVFGMKEISVLMNMDKLAKEARKASPYLRMGVVQAAIDANNGEVADDVKRAMKSALDRGDITLSLTPERKEALVKSAESYSQVIKMLENGIAQYNILVSKAKASGNEPLIDDLSKRVKGWNEALNMFYSGLCVRESVLYTEALNLRDPSDRGLNASAKARAKLLDLINGRNTLKLGENVVRKFVSDYDEQMRHFRKHVRNDGSTDLDDAVRYHLGENIKLKIAGAKGLSPSEREAAIAFINYDAGRIALEAGKTNWCVKWAKQAGKNAVPVWPFVDLGILCDYATRADTTLEFLRKDYDGKRGKVKIDDKVVKIYGEGGELEKIILYSNDMNCGNTNGGHFVGDKGSLKREIAGDCIGAAAQIGAIGGAADLGNAGSAAGGRVPGGSVPGIPVRH
jgi:hypothetical protein